MIDGSIGIVDRCCKSLGMNHIVFVVGYGVSVCTICKITENGPKLTHFKIFECKMHYLDTIFMMLCSIRYIEVI